MKWHDSVGVFCRSVRVNWAWSLFKVQWITSWRLWSKAADRKFFLRDYHSHHLLALPSAVQSMFFSLDTSQRPPPRRCWTSGAPCCACLTRSCRRPSAPWSSSCPPSCPLRSTPKAFGGFRLACFHPQIQLYKNIFKLFFPFFLHFHPLLLS